MDLRRRRWALAAGAVGFTAYGIFRALSSPSVARQKRRLSAVLGAFDSVAETVSDSAAAAGILSRDLKDFLVSDSDRLPRSLRQLCKLAASDEFHQSISRFTAAVTVGAYRGYRDESAGTAESGGSFADRVVDRMFSEEGRGFASVIVGSFSRNVVLGLFSEWRRHHVGDIGPEQETPRWVQIVCDDSCRDLIGDLVRAFVSTAVAVYLDKTMNINPYDALFSGMTNPEHEAGVRETLVSLCNTAVETYVRTSKTSARKLSFDENCSSDERSNSTIRAKLIPARKPTAARNHEGGWGRAFAATLAVPTNRRLVLDMMGTVTSESVRSLLDFVAQKLSVSMRRSAGVCEAKRFAMARCSAMASLCLSLCLYILESPWSFTPRSR